MSEPFIAQIQMWACNFAPRGWAFCNGNLLPIAENTALFSLIGTTYGGDGRATMGLPDLQGRSPMHPGGGPGLTDWRLGEQGGSETNTLTEATMPQHTHTFNADDINATATTTTTAYLAKGGTAGRGGRFFPINTYSPPDDLTSLSSSSLGATGEGQAYENMQPYQVLNFCIALTGIYPSRS